MDRFFSNKPLPKPPRDDSDSPPPLPPRHLSLQVNVTPQQALSGAKKTMGILDKIGAFENKSSGSANYQPISFVKPQVPSGNKPRPPPKGVISDYRNKPISIGLNINPTVVKPSKNPPALPSKPATERQIAHIAPTVVAPSSTKSIVSSMKKQLRNSGISDDTQNHQPTVIRPAPSDDTYSTLSFRNARDSKKLPSQSPSDPTVIRPVLPAARNETTPQRKWDSSPSEGHIRPAPPPPTVVKPRHINDSKAASHVSSLRGQLEGKLNLGQRPPSIVRPDNFQQGDSQATYDSLQKPGHQSDYDTFTPANHRGSHTRHAPANGNAAYSSVKKKGPAPARPPPPRKTPSPTHKTASHSSREPYAVVQHDFEGSHKDELSSKVGDAILLKREVDDEWTYGKNKRTGLHGIIPLNFLDVKLPLSEGTPISSPTHSPNSFHDPPQLSGPRGTALYDFDSAEPGDLNFRKGESIQLHRWLNENWLEGETQDGRRGIFPSNFVQIIEPPSEFSNDNQTSEEPETNPIVNALYEYNTGASGDLVFTAGDELSLYGMINADWLYGQNTRTGDEGMFPANFVDSVPDALPTFEIPRSDSEPNLATAAEGGNTEYDTFPGSGMRRSTTYSTSFGAGLDSNPEHSASDPWVGKIVTALYEYHPQDRRDLFLEPGDRIKVTGSEGADWLTGHIILDMSSKRALPDGLFPRNFVQLEQ